MITREERIFIEGAAQYNQDKEKQSTKQVVKISEMALSVDDKYLGEIGNPNYRDKKKMFEYFPESGVLIAGTKETVQVNTTDLVELPDYFGYVSFERMMGSVPKTYSGQEFSVEIAKQWDLANSKLNKVLFLFKAAELKNQASINQFKDFCTRTASGVKEQYSPEDVVNAGLNTIKRDIEQQHESGSDEEARLIELLKKAAKTGIFSPDLKKSQTAIVDYFYTCCEMTHIDASNPNALLKYFDSFWFTDELIAEFEKAPNARFGDALIDACKEYQKKLNEIE